MVPPQDTGSPPSIGTGSLSIMALLFIENVCHVSETLAEEI